MTRRSGTTLRVTAEWCSEPSEHHLAVWRIVLRFRDTRVPTWQSQPVATPADPGFESSADGVCEEAKPLGELEQELLHAVEEIEHGQCSVLSIADVDRWAETGVPPWSDDFRG